MWQLHDTVKACTAQLVKLKRIPNIWLFEDLKIVQINEGNLIKIPFRSENPCPKPKTDIWINKAYKKDESPSQKMPQHTKFSDKWSTDNQGLTVYSPISSLGKWCAMVVDYFYIATFNCRLPRIIWERLLPDPAVTERGSDAREQVGKEKVEWNGCKQYTGHIYSCLETLKINPS